jgi:hypothetical protein
MPDITTQVEYLANLEIYRQEKPYYIFYAEDDDEPKSIPPTNLQFELHENILVRDVRGREDQCSLDTTGFEIIRHRCKAKLPIETAEDIEAYKHEIEELLKAKLNALHVYCYEARVRISRSPHDYHLLLARALRSSCSGLIRSC